VVLVRRRRVQAGKWHGGGHLYGQVPKERGFDSSLAYLNGMEDHYTQVFNMLGGVDLFQVCVSTGVKWRQVASSGAKLHVVMNGR